MASASKDFTDFLSLRDITARPIPARRHNKNVIESRHKVIRDIFVCIRSDNAAYIETMSARQAIRISNDLYGNDVRSCHEFAKGFTRPIESGTLPKIIPQDVREAGATLRAKRKLNLILKSKSTTTVPIKVGNLVQIFIKLKNEKRGKWSSGKPVLSYDKISGIVTVPGQNGRTMNAAI